MSPEYFIGPAILLISAVLIGIWVNRSHKKCPFCRGMTIDFADMGGTDKGLLTRAMGITNQDLTRPRRIVVCEACKTAFDCRGRQQYVVTDQDRLSTLVEFGNHSMNGEALGLDDRHCCVCASRLSLSTDPSLETNVKYFVERQLAKIADELSDRPSYFCRNCGAVNMWAKAPESGYFILTTHPDLPLYPDSEYVRLAKQRAAHMEEISLGNAKWLFGPERIVARPPSFAKDPFGICNLAGEFVISPPEKKITCGKKNKAREWPLDDSWQVVTETFSRRTQLWEQMSENKETLGTAAQVKLFSPKHKIAFIMHVAQKYACEEVADKVRGVLNKSVPT